MPTNYQKLTLFEVLVVLLATAGIVLTGMVIFSGLNQRQQKHIAAAFEVFDLHESAIQATVNVREIYAYEDNFFNQFYLAFTQVATVEMDTYAYVQSAEFIKVALVPKGRVAGASIVNPNYGSPPQLIPYGYAAPNWRAWKQNLSINPNY